MTDAYTCPVTEERCEDARCSFGCSRMGDEKAGKRSGEKTPFAPLPPGWEPDQ